MAIGYDLLSHSAISEALTAAGADKNNPDGNKGLAQMGTTLIEYFVGEIGYKIRASRGALSLCSIYTIERLIHDEELVSQIRSYVTTAEHRARIAKRNGIDQCIKYSLSGNRVPSVLAQAVSALISSLHIEVRSPDITREAILRLG